MAESSLRGRRPQERLDSEGPYEMKPPYHVSEVPAMDDGYTTSPLDDGFGDSWGHEESDRRDMLRMGKKQEFKRNFHTLSALGFVSVYMVIEPSSNRSPCMY